MEGKTPNETKQSAQVGLWSKFLLLSSSLDVSMTQKTDLGRALFVFGEGKIGSY